MEYICTRSDFSEINKVKNTMTLKYKEPCWRAACTVTTQCL